MQQGSCDDKLKWMVLGGVVGFAAGAVVTSPRSRPSLRSCNRPRDEPITIADGSLKVKSCSSAPWSSWGKPTDHEWRHPTKGARIASVEITMPGYSGENPVIPRHESCAVMVRYSYMTLTFFSAGPQGQELHLSVVPESIPQVWTTVGGDMLQDDDPNRHIENVQVFRGGNLVGRGSRSEGQTTITIHYIS